MLVVDVELHWLMSLIMYGQLKYPPATWEYASNHAALHDSLFSTTRTIDRLIIHLSLVLVMSRSFFSLVQR